MANLSRNEQYKVVTDLLMEILLESKFNFVSPIGVGSKLVLGSGATNIAATDGINLFIEEPFFDYEKKYQKSILIHEMLHVFLGHTMRRGERDPTIWNMAADFIVNDNVIRTFKLELPEGVLYDPKYQDWATEQVYESLEFDEKMKEKLMQDLADARKEMEGKQMEGQAGGKPGQGMPGKPGAGGMPGKPGKDMVKGGFNASDVIETPESEKGEVMNRIHEGYSKGYGNIPGGIRQYLKNWLYPELPWETLLERFMDQVVKENYRFGPFRRAGMYRKIYMPTMEEESLQVAVCIDTSGSVGDEMVGKFLNEVRYISNMNNITGYMIPVAEHIEHVFEFPPFPSDREIEQYIKTGGTDFRPPFEYVSRNLDNDIGALVYLTDGEGPYPEVPPPYPVMWVLSVRHEQGSEWYPPFGDVIYLPSSER